MPIHIATSRILHLQWHCASQTELVYILGHSPSLHSRTFGHIGIPSLPFNGLCPYNPCKYMHNYSFTDPGGKEGRDGHIGKSIVDSLPTVVGRKIKSHVRRA